MTKKTKNKMTKTHSADWRPNSKIQNEHTWGKHNSKPQSELQMVLRAS
jgi:hypothetical protein